jgi:hypothetical protein
VSSWVSLADDGSQRPESGDVGTESTRRVVPAVQRGSVEEIEDAIGEPLMVPDPLLTGVQAAALLGVSLVEMGGWSRLAS